MGLAFFFRLAIFLVVAVSATTALHAQSLYKSVGPDGKIIYSDRPPVEGRIVKTMKFENLPSSALPASATSNVEQLRKNKVLPPSTIPVGSVVLYSASWCGYCKKAKSYLASKNIRYQEVDIDTKDGMVAFARAGGGKGVPLLIAGDQRVQGFSDDAYDALFANRK